jgi:hypothetical protein
LEIKPQVEGDLVGDLGREIGCDRFGLRLRLCEVVDAAALEFWRNLVRSAGVVIQSSPFNALNFNRGISPMHLGREDETQGSSLARAAPIEPIHPL